MPRRSKEKTDVKNWEKILESITVEPGKEEVLFDPYIIDTLLVGNSPHYLKSMIEDSRLEDEKRRQIDWIRTVAERKLDKRQRECILLLLSGCDSYTEIGHCLDISRDTVRRALQEAASKLKEHLENETRQSGQQNEKNTMLTEIFPLDTQQERQTFQRFVNENQVKHLALSSGPLREALVVYQN